ncbi:magnesium transporter [Sorangium sp. So ce394]|uniref:magnesium transporter n=1 Tax=Sorangium sp. So ce394 TaxID=3133310 RepID=UPI003F5B755F
MTTLLEKQRVIEALTHKQESKNKELIESLVHRQNLALLQRKLRDLHPADLAHIIEVLPQPDRLVVWAELEPHHAAQELFVGLMNGAVWGTLVGLSAMALYGSVPLGLVMAAAILLNLVVAAMVGCMVPIVLQRLGRDPAQGSSVLLTFTTDSMGFFIFLGLARAFLV